MSSTSTSRTCVYAAAQLTLEQTLLRGQQRAVRAQLLAADAANRCAVTNGVPAEQIVELNELLPLFRVVHLIPSASTLLKQGGAQDNDAAAATN